MCAIATMKRQYDDVAIATSTLPFLNMVDDVDAMLIVAHFHEQKQANRRKRRRTVRFNEQANEEHDVVVDDNTWLSSEDCKQIKDGAVRDIHFVAKSTLRPKTLLEKTVYSGSEGNDNDAPQLAPAGAESGEILENLTQWALYIEPGRGLENQVNSKLGKARRKHRLRAVRAVMVGQKIARQEAQDDEEGRALIGQISHEYSALAKQHALLMGKADERAAQDVYMNTPF